MMDKTIYTLRYDGSFDGLLTAVFERYRRKIAVDGVLSDKADTPMFLGEVIDIDTDEAKARRAWNGIKRILTTTGQKLLTQAYLSAEPGIDSALFRIIVKSVDTGRTSENDFSDPDVMAAWHAARCVGQERHRMLQFLRFQKAADGSYFAPVEPRYDVLPMAVEHFVDRFADQRFLIYDISRKYGFYYNGEETLRVTVDSDMPHLRSGRLAPEQMDRQEHLFQELWRTYFHAIAIAERANSRKQRQDMPARYWHLLTEMQSPPISSR